MRLQEIKDIVKREKLLTFAVLKIKKTVPLHKYMALTWFFASYRHERRALKGKAADIGGLLHAISVIGIVSVVFVISVFVRYNSTPIIMASGRELCYVLMAGMLLCYAMTSVMVIKPTLLTCALSRAGLGLSLALCYSALFTKTNRISRIFNRGLKAMVKRPSYTSPQSQLAICFLKTRSNAPSLSNGRST